MAETQIWVRTIYHDDKEFKGRKYTEHKLYSTDGHYYTSSKPFDPAIENGSDVLLEAEPTKNPKYFKVKKVIAFNVHAADSKGQASTQAGQGAGSLTHSMPEPLPALTPKLQASWIGKALEAMKQEGFDPEIENPLLVECVRQYFSEWMAERIQAGKAANIEKVSRERGRV